MRASPCARGLGSDVNTWAFVCGGGCVGGLMVRIRQLRVCFFWLFVSPVYFPRQILGGRCEKGLAYHFELSWLASHSLPQSSSGPIQPERLKAHMQIAISFDVRHKDSGLEGIEIRKRHIGTEHMNHMPATEKRIKVDEGRRSKKTYNIRDSLVVTDPTTSLTVTGLSMGERTGSRVLQYLWSYVF
jgi:hypothetical protein